MRIFTAVFFCVLFFTGNILTAKAMHLFLAGDTEDELLRFSSRKDCENVETVFSYIAEQCRVPLYTRKITSTDKTLTTAHLEACVQEANVAPNDVIIFYFTGHGDRSAKHTQMIWPRMRFSDCKVDAEKTIEKLFSKRAALTIVLFDCCNTFVSKSSDSRTIKSFQLKRSNDPRVAANFRKLFFKRCGVLIISAAAPGEAAGGDSDRHVTHLVFPSKEFIPSRGSYLTNGFFNSLIEEVGLPSPHWRSIFKKTKKICYNGSKKENKPYDEGPQTPQYVILIGSKKKEVREYLRYLQKHCIYRKGHHSKDLAEESHFPEKVRQSVYFEQQFFCDE